MGYSHRTFECPFFKWDDRLKVRCEGGRQEFPDREAIRDYLDCYCASATGWRECTVAENLLRYYDRKK